MITFILGVVVGALLTIGLIVAYVLSVVKAGG